jgi:phage gpG-like protein
MIKAEIIGSEEVVARLKEIGPNLKAELRIAVERFSLNTVGYIRSSKLSGSPLNHRTGKLQGSINYRVEEGGESVSGVIGTNAEYAAIHEYGYTGPENVKAHLRMITQAFGKSLLNPRQVQIGAHTRQMNMPERSFMRSSMKERTETFRNEVLAAGKRAIDK